MKMLKFSMNDMKKNLVKNVKIAAIIFSICILTGIVIGIISAKTYDPNDRVYKNEVEETVELSTIEKNEGYYFNAFYMLKQKSDYLNAYLDYFSNVELNDKSKDLLQEIDDMLYNYDKNTLEKGLMYYKNTALCIENEKSETIDFYSMQCNKLNEKLENKKHELKEIERDEDEEAKAKRKKINDSIFRINSEKDMYKGLIELLNNTDSDTVKSNSEIADGILNENIEELNNIIVRFNENLASISKDEQYEIIYNKRILRQYEDENGIKFFNKIDEDQIMNNKIDSAVVYAKSIEGLDVAKERFYAIFTFFVLFGIIVAILTGAFYKKDNYKDE